ncbi:MAG: hypothetical protein EOM20_15920, partial [Spartobacteria bacterium]|nr:hypothetical protein [Spartobacteria bacterium]
QALTVHPARQRIYTADVPVRVYTAHALGPGAVECAVDGKTGFLLDADRLWQVGVIPFADLPQGGHTAVVRRLDEGDPRIIDRILFYTCAPGERPLQQLSLSVMPPVRAPGSPLWLVARVTDPSGCPVADWPVKISTLQTRPVVDTHYEGVTDTNGQYTIRILPDGEPGSHLIVWGACDTRRGGCPDHDAQSLVIPLMEKPPRNPADYTIRIPRMTRKPVIDGRRDEVWGTAPVLDLSVPDEGPVHVRIRGAWQGNEDLSGRIFARWDEKNLYLLAEVRDASPAQNNGHDADIWRGDGLELFLGINPHREDKNTYSDTDFQFILAPDAKTWIYGQASGGTRNASADGVEIAVLPDQDGYGLEACVPWNNFAFVPREGDEIDVEFNLNNMVDGQGLPTKIFWATDGNAYRSPEGWGRAVLISE